MAHNDPERRRGQAKQWARGIGERQPLFDPADPRHPDHVDEGAGTQWARGIGEHPSGPDPRYPAGESGGAGKQWARGIGEPVADAADPRQPDHVDEGTGKQFARGVGRRVPRGSRLPLRLGRRGEVALGPVLGELVSHRARAAAP